MPFSVHVCTVLSVDPDVLVIVTEPPPNASLVVKTMLDEEVTLLMDAEVAGVTDEKVGALVSITMALFAARFVAGTKSVMVLLDVSLMVPAIEVTVRSLEVSPACTV